MHKYIMLILFSFLLAQNIEILDIKIEGIKRLQEEDIYRISKLYPGMYLNRGDEINKGINKLWEIGRFSDIQFYLDEENENGIILSKNLLGLNDSLSLIPASGKTLTAGSDFTFFQQVFSNLRSGRFATAE